jgi:membrane fusion protein, macrolide-specific efflux system
MAAMRGPSKLPSPIASARRGWHNWALGLLCLIVVVAAITSIGSSSADSASTQRTATVERGVVQSTVSGNGSLEAAQQVELNFGTSGAKLTEVDVEAGEKVSKGEVLARIDSSSARASLASAEAQLSEAEETLEAAREDEEVSASYEGAARTEEAPSEAESSSPSGTATVSVATAEAKLRQARLSVESARQEVRETALRAPISGTIASVSGSVGETVSGEGSAAGGGSGTESGGASTGGLGAAGSSDSSSGSSSSSAFIVLSQLDRLKMEVSFSESDIGKVKVGQPATVSVSSMEGTELAGRVTKVDVLPSEGSSSGVVEYPATITLAQSAKGVRAGMSASAEVVVEQVSNALSVTSEAISSGPGGGSVTVLEDGREVERSVTTGLKGDETTQILSGVEAGETVVLPEIMAAAGGGGPAGGLGEGGAFPGGGSLPSFGSGGPPAGFPGAP